MPIQFDTFDQPKINRLKTHLESNAAKGQAKYYEIYVDNLRAVQKTDDPNEFEGYEDYMDPDTSQIKIVIYSSGASPRNDQYVFSLKAKNSREALDQGLDGLTFQTFTKNDLTQLRVARDKKNSDVLEIQSLKQEVGELNEELDEKVAYIERLETGIEQAKANANKLGGVHLGEIVSVALEGLVRRNTHLIAQVPALNGLAGIIDKDSERTTNPVPHPAPESEVTFKKKEEQPEAPGLNEQQKYFLQLFSVIRQHFNEKQFEQVMDLLEYLSKDKTKLEAALALFNSKDDK